MAMNSGKVVTGGLLAGLVFLIGDFLINGVFLAAENAAMLQKLGLDPNAMNGASAMVPFAVVDLLLGILVVYTYAAIRPRFGPGAGTAIKAGLILYTGITLVVSTFVAIGMMTTGLFVTSSLLQLVSTIVGSIAGAWAYTEA